MSYDIEEGLQKAVELYIYSAEDAYSLCESYIITSAHEFIKKNQYKTETEYYEALTDFIIKNL